MRDYILIIDEGTTGTRAVIFDKQFRIIDTAYTEFTQYTPAENKVEHDFEEIYEKTVEMCKQVLQKTGLGAEDVACIGITNQRNTAVLWDKNTGKPYCNGIVWQDTRTADLLTEKNKTGYADRMMKLCGYTASCCVGDLVIEWLLKNNKTIKEAVEKGDALYGTIDCWLIWKLTGGKSHVISSSNASALGFYDPVWECWCKELMEEAGFDDSFLPTVLDEDALFGTTDILGAEIPITGVVADQQSSLFGQNCHEAGTVKCTNGTGSFLDVNIGDTFAHPSKGMNTMIAWTIGGKRKYLFEGYMATSGSAVQWLRDGIKIIEKSSDTYELAMSVPNSNGVYFVISLAGANMPNSDPYSRGTIYGITRGTTEAHIARATLEGIALGVNDIMEAIEKESGVKITSIKVDGGASNNDFLAQSFADYIDCEVARPDSTEATAIGAAMIASLGAGIYTMENLPDVMNYDKVFYPAISKEEREEKLFYYHKAVDRSLGWLKK